MDKVKKSLEKIDYLKIIFDYANFMLIYDLADFEARFSQNLFSAWQHNQEHGCKIFLVIIRDKNKFTL